MGISAFQILAQVAGSFNINNVFFSPVIEFPEIPNNSSQIIQIQITTDQAATIEVTFNDGASWSVLNNGGTILGLATFTMMVFKGSQFNMRNTDVAGLAVTATVAA